MMFAKPLQRSSVLLAVSLCALLVGCGDGKPSAYPVSGVVTYQDKPVEGAQVIFMTTGGRPAEGTTDTAGKFVLTTFDKGDGALPGQHKVTIVKMVKPANADPNNPYVALENALPKRYATTAETPLTEEVKTSGANEFKFSLSDS